jgi:hypothetical protein
MYLEVKNMFVKKDLVKFAVLSIAIAALLSTMCFAADEPKAAPKPDVVKVQGIVNVTKDANNVVTKVVVVAEKEIYNVVLDAKGLDLGKTMDGKKAEIQGTVAKKGTELLLTVQSFKAVEVAPPKPE